MTNYLERFSTAERLLHWIVTVSFFTLVLSALGLFSRLFTGYFQLFGNGRNAIMVHKIAAVIYLVSSSLFFLQHWKGCSRFDAFDWQWLKACGGYLTRKEVHLDVGMFNFGQKIFALFIGFGTILLGITGLFIWHPTLFPRLIVQFSLMTHALLFIGSIMFVIVHVYLGTIGNPGTLEGMLWGRVRRRWALNEHSRWYREKLKAEE